MPRLTDTEKSEIARLLEQDKPLPDHYRFLLFDDKREVKLVWNGKMSLTFGKAGIKCDPSIYLTT